MFFFWVSSQDLSSKSRKGEGKTNHNEYRVYDIWLHGGMYIVLYKINMGDSQVLQIWVLAGMVGLQNIPKFETSPVGHLVCSCWFHQKLRWFSMMVTFQNGHNSKTGKRVSDSWELHFSSRCIQICNLFISWSLDFRVSTIHVMFSTSTSTGYQSEWFLEAESPKLPNSVYPSSG